jgi:hypothetical protein
VSETTEYQLVRPDGTVLTSAIAAEGFMPPGGPESLWSPPSPLPIKGKCYGRMRTLPDGPWKVIACYPEGFWSETFYDEGTGTIQTLTAPALWDMTGENAFLPYDPGAPVEVRGPEVQPPGG